MQNTYLALANKGANHASRPGTYDSADGFARALCRSTLWVSVEHDEAGRPVPADPHDLSCHRCMDILARNQD